MLGMLKFMARCCCVLLALSASLAIAETVTVRSGNGTAGNGDSSVTLLLGPASSDFSKAFTQSDFSSAQSGPAAFVLNRNPLWVSGLSADTSAKWIGTNQNASSQGNTALYAVSFQITHSFSLAALTLHWAADDGLGTTDQGLYLNGTAVCGNLIDTSNQFVQAHNLACNDVGPLLRVGTNWLYLDAVNAAGPAGLLFSATIVTTETVQPPLSITSFPVGSGPIGIASDGANMWVTNGGSNNVTKLRASDGVVLGTFPVGGSPGAVVFDGANVWIAYHGPPPQNQGYFVKLRPSDGTALGNFAVGRLPTGSTFDGFNIWVGNYASNNVTKLRASDGVVLGTFPGGNTPSDVIFDGTNTWVTNTEGSNSVTKMRASDGQVVGIFPVGNSPLGAVFDGANIWVANGGANNVTKLRAADGTILGTFQVGNNPVGIAFDGANIWVANYQDNTVSELRASDGLVQGTLAVGSKPHEVVFDGSNIWVTNEGSNTVSKVITLSTLSIPSINPSGVVNAASSLRGAVAPGSIASVYGSFPLGSPSQANVVPWPNSLSELSMQFAGIQAPLYYASGGLVNLQIPWELAGQTQPSVTATVGGQTSSAQTVNLSPFSPGLFSMNSQGSGQGAILDSRYRLVDSSNPASVGDVIQIYSTGLGAVTNQPASGSPARSSPLAETTTTPVVTIGGTSAQVFYSGLTPGSVGLYQVNAQVPTGIVTGPAVPVMVSIGGVASNTVTVAIQPFPASPNPQPTVRSLSPSSVTVGTSSLTLTINGSGFIRSSTVTLNGAPHPQSFVASNQVTILLSAWDLATVGTFPVIVSNPSPGGGVSQDVSFTVSAAANPQPSITNLSPSSATVGSNPLVLTITGSGFIGSASVTFNGISHPASFVNSGQLTITLPASDLSKAGTFTVLVTTPSPGGGVSNSMTFAILAPAPSGLTGNWTGGWGSIPTGALGLMSATLVQTGTALRGSILLDSICLPGGPLSGTVIGNAIDASITISGLTLVAFKGTVTPDANTLTGAYLVRDGPCIGDYGAFTLSRSR